MATVYTTEYNNAYVVEPSVKNDVTKLHGRVRLIKADITFAAELAVSDVIKICKLPKGARVIDARVVAPADAASGIYNVGWEANGDIVADADGLFVGASECDFGAAALDAKLKGTSPSFGKKFEAETVISATVTEISTDATGNTHQFCVFYLVD
jgi:hypothetical protein